MRLDYSEKMTAVRDSAERNRPVQKNRPRREPIGGFLLVALVLLVIGYGAGVLTGWFLFHGKNPQAAVPPAAQQAKAPAAAQTPQGAGAVPGQPGQPGQPAPDVPLTFYKTLPSGGKGAIGSGINTKLPEVLPKSAPATPQAAPEQKAAQAAPPAGKGGDAKPAEKASAAAAEKQAEKQTGDEKQAAEPRYLVQVASYKDKQEAESARAKLTAKGVAAYVVESKLKDKGVWYRIRVGKHLSKQEAQQLAGKVGSGAAVVTE
ncbi:SPOR domain-containing protein [Geomonas ferrireducens]|jgi:cell division septation protein DedD|uniref:SPOR domain-containing protein n=1 Tax=Geomonas ferrireducens TaxID=2570227 RepID=UPI0010A8D47B|nr:SPOR domain-containing protein [Geomonas ferrireducens]